MKKSAWTLAELTVVMVAVLILTAATMTITKNININKTRIYMYSAMRNITMGNISVTEENDEFYPTIASSYDADSTKTDDWYCLHFADAFALKGSPNCTKTTDGSMNVNLVYSNGISFRGLASPWKNAYGDLFYKDILVDIDEDNGVNKVGMDRFPLRVFRGTNAQDENMSGFVYPVDCKGGNDYLYDADGNKITLSHSYCASSNSNIASNEEIISYGVYRVTNPNQSTKATILAASKSALEADCVAYGSKGFYGGKICSEKGFVIDDRCAHEDLCEDCETYGICAGGSKDACLALAESNKLNVPNEDNPAVTEKTAFRCFTLMTKPTGGMGLITGSLIGDLGI